MRWLDLIGWGGSALLVWSLLQSRILRLRAINLAGSVLLVFFNGALRVWPMVGLNAVLAVINMVYLVRLLRSRHDERAYTVVEPGSFVHHVLKVHAKDIAAFFPGFRLLPGRLTYLVMRRDEVVGVVVARDGGDGVAYVELDYVTQRFRDFTPGEFVYKHSRLFTDRGFRKVVTPSNMVAPYYPNLGFRREGDSYVLDLSASEPAG